MSNEYKEMLKAAARDFLDGTLQQDSGTGEYLNLGEVEEIYSDISIELDHVYTRAAKADEYEVKAKVLDGVKELINTHDCAIEEESGLGHLFLLDLKSIMKYAESGESQ